MDETVTIHGDEWKWTDIEESVEWARKQEWTKQKWVPRAALVSRGKISDYVGQKFIPEYTKLVEDGWDHDHCEICSWKLHETEDPLHGEGFTIDGHDWLCQECFIQFIASGA